MTIDFYDYIECQLEVWSKLEEAELLTERGKGTLKALKEVFQILKNKDSNIKNKIESNIYNLLTKFKNDKNNKALKGRLEEYKYIYFIYLVSIGLLDNEDYSLR